MRKESRFWRSMIRGWAAGLLVASTPFAMTFNSAHAGEGYFIGDDQPAVSASDVQVAPKSAYQAPAAPGYQACQPACDTCDSCDSCCDDDAEPFRLFAERNKCADWAITGFLEGGFTFNRRDVPSNFNGPVSFNDQMQGQFNQAYVQFENAIDTEENGWDVGGRVDLLYGSDYIFNQVVGWELHDDGSQHWNGNPDYGLAMPQAYAEFGYNDLAVKVGRFYTPVGYEVVPATGNFFYSHAYTHQYGEPFYHVGALATYKYSDTTTLIGGLVNGWDAFDRLEDHVGGVGGVLWTGDDLSVALTGTISQEPSGAPAGFDDFGQRSMYSVVVTRKFSEKVTYVFQHDAGVQENGNVYRPGGTGAGVPNDAEWYSINQYLYYTINTCWKAGTRFEWFRDDDGFRVAGIRPGNPIGVGPGRNGFAGNFYEMTYGLNWTPTTNLMIRPEIRYDWYDAGGLATPLPYNDGHDTDQFLAAFDVVYIW